MQTVSNTNCHHKRELSWDDFADGNLPPHETPTVDEQHRAFFSHAVARAVATMD